MRCEEARAALLEGRSDPVAEQHLATCPECARHLPELTEARGRLIDPVFWVEPPPELEERVVRLIAGETSAPMIARRSWWPRLAAMVAAALLAVVAVTGWIVTRDAGPDWEVPITGVDTALPATGTVAGWNTEAGTTIRLEVEGLGTAPHGNVYEMWLAGDDGVISAGTFASADSAVDLAVGVARRDYPRILVTLEPLDADPTPSQTVVLDSGG